MEIQYEYALHLQSHEAHDLFEQTEGRAKSPGSDANADAVSKIIRGVQTINNSL